MGPELGLEEPGGAEERKGWGEGREVQGPEMGTLNDCSPGNEVTGSWGGRSAALGRADWEVLTFIEVQPTVP